MSLTHSPLASHTNSTVPRSRYCCRACLLHYLTSLRPPWKEEAQPHAGSRHISLLTHFPPTTSTLALPGLAGCQSYRGTFPPLPLLGCPINLPALFYPRRAGTEHSVHSHLLSFNINVDPRRFTCLCISRLAPGREEAPCSYATPWSHPGQGVAGTTAAARLLAVFFSVQDAVVADESSPVTNRIWAATHRTHVKRLPPFLARSIFSSHGHPPPEALPPLPPPLRLLLCFKY